MGAIGKARAICTNKDCKPGSYGHNSDEVLPGFCEKCGKEVISACPNCGRSIFDLIPNQFADPPNHCSQCGEELRR
jgi:hypothetical protein